MKNESRRRVSSPPPSLERNKTITGRRYKNMFKRTATREPSPPWIDLPRDLTANILARLGTIDRLVSAQKVCTTWQDVCRDYPHMWRVIHMAKLDVGDHITPHDLRDMCRDAVDCCHGELVDITMDGFCNDRLLRYISKKCSQLQRLRVAFCDDVSDKGLIEALEMFPVLSELYLFPVFSKRSGVRPKYGFDIESIGRSCPMLHSFTFTLRVDKYRMSPNDGVTLAVAKNMPGLRHLRLLGNGMTETGLEAILDGCPHLESLDIRLCKNLDRLSEDTIERCRRQIRQVWLPNDSCSDHEFYDRFQGFVTWVRLLRKYALAW